VDGKSLRSTRHASSDAQQVGAVLGQAKADGKTNEVTQSAPLLEPLNLARGLVTADAMHTLGDNAEFLISQKTAFILIVKKN